MSREDKRHEDRGPDHRRLDYKTLLMITALLLNVAVVVWKGGEISGKFTSLLEKVEKMNTQLQSVLDDQKMSDRTLSVQQERISQHGDRLSNHESRITRIEDRSR